MSEIIISDSIQNTVLDKPLSKESENEVITGVPMSLYQSEVERFVGSDFARQALIDELFDYEVCEMLGLI